MKKAAGGNEPPAVSRIQRRGTFMLMMTPKFSSVMALK